MTGYNKEYLNMCEKNKAMSHQAAIEGLVSLNALQENTQKILAATEKENRKFRKALEFYSDPGNLWEIKKIDFGRKAREALGVAT